MTARSTGRANYDYYGYYSAAPTSCQVSAAMYYSLYSSSSQLRPRTVDVSAKEVLLCTATPEQWDGLQTIRVSAQAYGSHGGGKFVDVSVKQCLKSGLAQHSMAVVPGYLVLDVELRLVNMYSPKGTITDPDAMEFVNALDDGSGSHAHAGAASVGDQISGPSLGWQVAQQGKPASPKTWPGNSGPAHGVSGYVSGARV